MTVKQMRSERSEQSSRLLAERTHEVAGSIPVRVAFASVAQLVERMPEEHGVAGSTPAEGTSSVSSNGRTLVSDASNVSSILSAETTQFRFV